MKEERPYKIDIDFLWENRNKYIELLKDYNPCDELDLLKECDDIEGFKDLFFDNFAWLVRKGFARDHLGLPFD